jgi:hypothetical protein
MASAPNNGSIGMTIIERMPQLGTARLDTSDFIKGSYSKYMNNPIRSRVIPTPSMGSQWGRSRVTNDRAVAITLMTTLTRITGGAARAVPGSRVLIEASITVDLTNT